MRMLGNLHWSLSDNTKQQWVAKSKLTKAVLAFIDKTVEGHCLEWNAGSEQGLETF